ncbi:MAG: DegV family protein [Candidatus Paceibacterota bacterium]
MQKATVIVCSFASTTKDILDKYGIIALTPSLNWPEGEGLKGDNIFQKMRKAVEKGVNSTPKTSQPPMGAFKKAYDEALSKSENTIVITISSKISGTYNAAIQTRKMFSEEMQKRIHIIDSNNIDAAESLLAIKACELSERGEDIQKIVETINNYVNKTYFFGMTENPNQMEAGGRISHTLAVILAQMQKIGLRPILHMKDGKVKPANLSINAKDIAEALLKHFEEVTKKAMQEGKKYRVAISHADNIEKANELKSLLLNRFGDKIKVDFISMTGPFIGAHVGPGTLMCATLEE